jgi:hypothetical protein
VCFFAATVFASEWQTEFQAEFDDLCGQVQIADSMSIEELYALIERVDKLIPLIQGSNNPQRKVYIFRLKKCRNFFEYIIELKKNDMSG